MRRALDLLGELDGAGRWPDLAAAAARCRRLAAQLKDGRPDVVDVIEAALGKLWTGQRMRELLALQHRDDEGRAVVRSMIDAFGPSLAP